MKRLALAVAILIGLSTLGERLAGGQRAVASHDRAPARAYLGGQKSSGSELD